MLVVVERELSHPNEGLTPVGSAWLEARAVDTLEGRSSTAHRRGRWSTDVDRRVVEEAGGETRGPETSRLGDGDVLNLRIQPLDLNAEVLLEREPDGIFDRQPPDIRGLPGLSERGRRRERDCRD